MKRAFIFGVSHYNNPSWKDLWGVEEDILRWQYIVKDIFGVPPESTRVLFDQRCTKDAILERIDWLFQGATSDDTIYVIYGGHGAQFSSRDENGLPSRLSECIVPYDFNWDSPLTDEVLAAHIREKNTTNCNIVCFLDCCHSGGLIRDIETNAKYPFIPEYPREIPLPPDIQFRVEVARGMGIESTSFIKTLQDQALIFCACSADQKAWESWVNGDFRGVFSFAIEEVLKTGENRAGALIEKCVALINQRGFRAAKLQSPFVTKLDATFF